MGIKHIVVALIYEISQKDDETMRDCSKCLRHYIARCLKGKMPRLAYLVSIFLKVLKNKPLHAHLCNKKHSTRKIFINDSINLNNSYETYNNPHTSVGTNIASTMSEETSKSKAANADTIADIVI